MIGPPHLIRPDGGSHRCAGLQARDCLPAPDDDDPDQMTIISAPAAAAAVPTHPSFEVSANVSGAVLHVTVATLPPARQIMRAPVNNMFIIDTGLCWTQWTLDTRSQLVVAVLVTTAVVAASAGWRPLAL